MIKRPKNTQQIPLNIVGSSIFGPYSKMSSEKTYNMYISDNWLIPYSGYKAIIRDLGVKGRGIHASNIFSLIIVAIGNQIYSVSVTYNPSHLSPYTVSATPVGTISTGTGPVYFAENNNGQILISDNSHLYIFQPPGSPAQGNQFQQLVTDFIPGYITFHDGRFISPDIRNNNWRLSETTDPTLAITWPNDSQHVGLIQTKPDTCVAVTRFPSRGNMIFVFGENVTESWFDVGYQKFPYQRNTSMNIDYGCVSAATIAAMDEVVVWLGQNERSGPIIVYSDGGMTKKISTDGIDAMLSNLVNPGASEGYIFRQDGHMFYHINFIVDNFSLFYDFNTEKFFNASDEEGDYYIVRRVAFLNNQYYAISRNNGNLYALDTLYSTYDGAEIPRIRVCASVKLPTQDYFTVTDVGFTMAQGDIGPIYNDFGDNPLVTQDSQNLLTEDDNFLIAEGSSLVPSYPRVDLSFSVDGGQSYSQYISYDTNPLGKRVNKAQWWRLGLANDWTPQFRFYGIGPFVATDGIVNIRT